MVKSSAETRNIRKEWISWAAIGILPLLFYPKVLSSAWVSSSDVHALLEFWAGLIALTAAGVVLIHFFATGRRFFLMISLGFTLQGAEDIIHAIYSFTRIWPVERAGIIDFIPGTYVAGRIIFVVCILIALYLEKVSSIAKKRTKEAIVYNSIGFMLAIITTILIINSRLPHFILSGRVISRPVDFITALVYLIAICLFINLYRHKKHRTPFMWSVIISLILGCITQVYMVHSQQLYDAQFDISHVVKIFSYIFPIFGITIGTFGMYKKEEKLAMQLTEASKFPSENPSPVLRINGEGKMLYQNEAAGTLLRKWNLPENDVFKILPGNTKENIKKVLKNNKPIYDLEIRLADEIYSYTMIPIKEWQYVNIYGFDITERNKAEEELKETQSQLIHAEKMEAVGRMASGVAHEVKNPLGIVLQGINYLEGEIPLNQKDKHELLQSMKNSIKRADSIVRALLDFSRTEELEIEPKDVNSIIKEALKLVAHRLKIKGVEVFQKLEDDIPKILGDRRKIEQVFVNLFENAIDAMPKGGKLYIRSYPTKLSNLRGAIGNRKDDIFKLEEEVVVVEVEDTGVGIDEDIKKKIFDPFCTTKDRAQGTGLGLSVVSNIIDIHGGSIDVRSKKGKGTKFTITFKLS